jgi:hypothetical protein
MPAAKEQRAETTGDIGGGMATKSDFTEQEWEAMHKGVTGAGLLMSVSDRSFFDTFKEAGALGRHLSEARQGSSNELLRELAETRGTGFGVTASPGEVESETLQALQTGVQALDARAPADADAYRAFVLEVAESVGNAAGGGEPAETATLEKIRSALERR